MAVGKFLSTRELCRTVRLDSGGVTLSAVNVVLTDGLTDFRLLLRLQSVRI